MTPLSNNYFLPYQRDWIADESAAKLWDKSRRIGATYAESYAACSLRNRIDYRRDYWFSSADESAAVEFALYCQQWCRLIEAVTDSFTEQLEDDLGYKYNNYVVVFPNGSRVNCMSSNPRRFRSKGGDVCLDEFDFHDEPGKMLDAAMPVTTWGYSIKILTTRNYEGTPFDQMVKLAKKIKSGEATHRELKTLAWSYHYTPITVAIEQGLAEKIKKMDQIDSQTREDFLADCRARARNESAFMQEYMCVPSAESSALITYDMYQACESEKTLGDCTGSECYLGFDVGRYEDRFSLCLGEQLGDVIHVRKWENRKGIKYRAMETMLGDIIAGNNKIVRVCGDATGLGDMLVEYLQDRFGEHRVEKIKFTMPSKDAMASKVLGGFQDKRVRVPSQMEMREDVHKVRKTVTPGGNPRYDSTRDAEGHADYFWSLALMLTAAADGGVKPEVIWV